MNTIKRFIIVQETIAGSDTYQELDETNFASEANRLATYHNNSTGNYTMVLCSYTDHELRQSLPNYSI